MKKVVLFIGLFKKGVDIKINIPLQKKCIKKIYNFV